MEETVKKKRSIWWTEMLFAAICAAIAACGRSIYNFDSLADIYYKPLEYGALFLFVFIPLIFVFALIGAGVKKSIAAAETAVPEEKEDSGDDAEKPVERKRAGIYRFFPLITSLLVIVSGVLALLSYFPGILGYDSQWQTLQAFGLMPLSGDQSVIHTLFWNFFIALEWFGIPHPYGLLIYCIVQILIVSGVCGYVTAAQIKAGCKWPVPVLTMLFYVLYPAFSVFSVGMTADVLFSCVVVRLFLRLSAVGTYNADSEDGELKKQAAKKENLNFFGIVFLIIIGSLLRINLLTASAMLVIVFFFMRKKNGMKKALFAVFGAIAATLIVLLAVYPLSGVQKTASHRMLAVPVNQISSVSVKRYSGLTIAERFLIESYMEAGRYNPRYADAVGVTFNDGLYDSDMSAFWDLYMYLFRQYPEDFADAFLTQNVQLWYPGARITDRYASVGYIDNENIPISVYMNMERPVLPGMRGFYDMVINEIEHSGTFGGLAFSLSIPFYMIIAALYIAVKRKHPGFTSAVIMAFFLWVTLLFGPYASFGELHSFFLLIPAFLAPVFAWGNMRNKEKVD